MENEYIDYLTQTEDDLQKKYISNMARQQNLRNFFGNTLHFGGVPRELEVVLNYLYKKEIQSTKFNDIDLESSIYNNLIINHIN